MDKIVCVGKNYVEHARELGDAVPEKPVLFLKPPSVLAVAKQGETLNLKLPTNAGLVHHETEIVLRLGSGGFGLTLAEAAATISEVTVGLDMTLRDRQTLLKKNGHPWTTAKVFQDAAVIGPWKRLSEFPLYLKEPFTLAVDGVTRQTGRGEQMSFSPAACVAYITEFFPVQAGDIIFTGTPAGVNSVTSGQKAELKWGEIHYFTKWR